MKLEQETFLGLSRGIVHGTLRVYKDKVVFKTNDTVSDILINKKAKGFKIVDVKNGKLTIPINKITSARKNSFRIGFMQHSLHINLKDGEVLIFRMQASQAERLANAINKLI